MSNIDKQALREAAEKAGAEVWCAFIDTKSKTYAVHTPDDDRCGDVVKWPGLDGQQRAAAKARFIAAANPATVLALLDELEFLDKRNAELNSTLERWAVDRAQSASELDDAEKRIAELEAREVCEEGNQFLVVRHPGKSPIIKHSAGDLEGFLRQLLEHDPMATIDIVTHRYYGVGGQWVQDADEYLQMMTVAAGKGGE